MEQTYMKEKPILPLLLSMAAPMILSMLVNSLYNIIDSIFVAKISEDAMTALSLVFPIQNVVNSVAVGFGIGINVMIAFCLGANQREQADKAASQGMFLSIVHGIILSITGILIMPSFLKLFTNNQDTLSLGLRYSNIVLLFAVIINVEIFFEKYFQAMGMMVVSMLSMLLALTRFSFLELDRFHDLESKEPPSQLASASVLPYLFTFCFIYLKSHP